MRGRALRAQPIRIGPRLRVGEWVVLNSPGRRIKGNFINGDLSEKMLIFKIKFKNVGFVNIHAVASADVAARRPLLKAQPI